LAKASVNVVPRAAAVPTNEDPAHDYWVRITEGLGATLEATHKTGESFGFIGPVTAVFTWESESDLHVVLIHDATPADAADEGVLRSQGFTFEAGCAEKRYSMVTDSEIIAKSICSAVRAMSSIPPEPATLLLTDRSAPEGFAAIEL
jgi:hypothetical protein